MLISEIRDEIIRETGNVGQIDDSELQTVVLSFIKNALRRFPRHISDKSIIAVKTGTLSSAATTMSLPSGVVRLRPGGIYTQTSGGIRYEVYMPKDTREFNKYFNASGSGRPRAGRIYGTTIEFDRAANQDYTINFECYQEIDAVVLADTWVYGSDAIEVLKDGAKWLLEEDYAENQAGTATPKRARFAAGVQKMNSDAIQQQLPDHVVENDGGRYV